MTLETRFSQSADKRTQFRFQGGSLKQRGYVAGVLDGSSSYLLWQFTLQIPVKVGNRSRKLSLILTGVELTLRLMCVGVLVYTKGTLQMRIKNLLFS